jgi:hypothetical protein
VWSIAEDNRRLKSSCEQPAVIDDGLSSSAAAANRNDHRHPIWGGVILLLIAAAESFLVGYVLSNITEWADEDSLEFLLPVTLLIPSLMTIGFAFTIPLLWLRRVAGRSLVALAAAFSLWGSLSLGLHLSQSGWDAEPWLQVTGVLLLAFVGASLPIGLVMWLFHWRIQAPGYAAPPAPIGIIDLMALTALGAVVFGYERMWGPFSDDQIPWNILVLITVFYSLIGVVITSSLLLAMRMMLGVDRRPFVWPNVVGMVLTVALVSATWALPFTSESVPGSLPAVLMWLILSAVSWLTAAATACAVCWWLRRYGFQLTSTAMARLPTAEQ